jgi:hypothetical protein
MEGPITGMATPPTRAPHGYGGKSDEEGGATLEDKPDSLDPSGGFGGDGDDGGGTALGDTPDSSDPSDREQLLAFILEFQHLLDVVVRERDWLPENLRGLYGQSLDDIQPDFALVVAQLEQPAIDSHLAVAGLVGNPRKLKTAIWDFFKGTAETVIEAAQVALHAANTILGSLSPLPGVEALDEFKKTVESGLEIAAYFAKGNPKDG